MNVFIGQNAQGKTNFLEAAAALADGRSFRNGKLNELIQKGFTGAIIDGQASSLKNQHRMQVRFEKTGRSYWLDGKSIADLKEYLGKILFVVFSADHLNIVSGTPLDRRLFLDHGVFSIRPVTASIMKKYKRALKERNALLSGSNPDLDVLHSYSIQLAQTGSRIIYSRIQYIRKILPFVQDFHSRITHQIEKIEIEYQNQTIQNGDTEEAIEAALLRAYTELTEPEIEQHTTLYGPHRDDLKIRLNGSDLRFYGSRGQRRTLVLSIKLAEIALINQLYGENPVLILDDVAAELDESRRKSLFELVPDNTQVLVSMTECDERHLNSNKKLFNVIQGNIYSQPVSRERCISTEVPGERNHE